MPGYKNTKTSKILFAKVYIVFRRKHCTGSPQTGSTPVKSPAEDASAGPQTTATVPYTSAFPNSTSPTASPDNCPFVPAEHRNRVETDRAKFILSREASAKVSATATHDPSSPNTAASRTNSAERPVQIVDPVLNVSTHTSQTLTTAVQSSSGLFSRRGSADSLARLVNVVPNESGRTAQR